MVINYTHGFIRRLRDPVGLPNSEPCDYSRPLSNLTHTGFHCNFPWLHSILKTGPCASLPSDPCRHSQDCHHTPFGVFEFRRMPFGLRNVAQTFQRFIDQVLRGHDFCHVYIDDVLIASRTTEEHKVHIHLVLQCFVQYGILINPVKCVLGVSELRFLGHHVNKAGVSPVADQVQVIMDFPQPTTLCKLREFLGLVNFYHRFLPDVPTFSCP